ncbi:MAG: glutamate--tRNA ligase [Candidatus Pacebacteria bacterium]|nr:glutamate--tRNA ligase [Candidatus Paceibacterota bacterium]
MKKRSDTIVTRFAPSPTGNLHVGSARTALFNFLYARKMKGKFILRIEDTDKGRSKKEFEDDILASLQWLGLKYDEFYRQSERTDIYRNYLKKLIDEGKAYISEEEVKKEGDRASVIRFKNPNKKVTFSDEVRGEVTFDTTELGDFVIAKNLETPLYHFVVVVDDFEMGITHVIRGEDHISNTPRQILIQEAIDADRPTYAHLPLILASDKSKLSKRHGAVSTQEYKEMGYLPEALDNFLALIGWNPGDDREVFILEELINTFSLDRIQKGGAVFNQKKLSWINKQHMHKLSEERLFEEVKKYIPKELLDLPTYSDNYLKLLIPTIIERISTLGEISAMAEEGELTFFFECPKYDEKALLWKKDPDVKITRENLNAVIGFLEVVNEDNFTEDTVKEAVWNYAEDKGRGDVLWPMRYALSGRERSPDPFTLAKLLGKKETLVRLKVAVEKLSV